ncbi:MAG TPA: class I SAM-dependent methyltransferase [Candidatus Deferrimicrobiaceae bacterium]
MKSPMALEEVGAMFRSMPEYADLVRNCYIDADVHGAAERFLRSSEFAETLHRICAFRSPGIVLDLGAGNGIASYAFASSGARKVYPLEPDPGDTLGRGAIRRVMNGMAYEVLAGDGERISLPDASVDLVYSRQVLHHARSLGGMLAECARVLCPGGVFFACREHVVDDEMQKVEFLANHPVHRYTGGENAYSLQEYLEAIRGSGMDLKECLGPWDSVINAFPEVRSDEELKGRPVRMLLDRHRYLGPVLAHIPFAVRRYGRRLKADRSPGRLYAFLAVK